MTTKSVLSVLAATTIFCVPDILRAAEPVMLEEITVRARKLDESIQDVPISMAAFSGAALVARGNATLDEIAYLVPNVASTGTGAEGGNNISIRGLSTTGNNPGIETGIGLYLDEVYIGKSFAFMTSLMDVERIEVLRGPQGTLFGRNTVGGAISLFTAKPDDEVSASADFTYGNYDLMQIRGRVSAPIIAEKVAVSLSGLYRKRDGYLEDFARDADYNDEDSRSVRAKVSIKASDSLEILVTGDYYEDKNIHLMDIRGGALAGADAFALKERMVGTDFASFSERKSHGLSGHLTWTGDDVEITSITAYRSHETDALSDQDFSVVDISYTGRLQDQEQFSQEVRLASNIGDRFNYLVGLYYFHQKEDSLTTANLGTGVLPAPETAFTTADIKGNAYAAFTSFDYAVTEQFTLSGGIRYSQEKKQIDYSQALSDGAFLMPILGIAVPIPALHDKISDGAVTGNLSISYKPSEDVMFYASYGRGFKAGGFNGTVLGTTVDALAFDAEFLDSYEVGMKSSWWQGRIQLNASLFHMDYSDKQEQTNIGTTFLVANSGAATSKGFEVELQARPHPQFTIGGGIGYTDATYDSYRECANVGGTFVDCTGNRLALAPKYTANLAMQFEQPIAHGIELVARGEINHRSASFIDPINNPDFIQQKLTLVNARLALQSTDSGWSVALWGKNLFNTDRQVLSFDFLGTQYARLNDPRTYGVELRASF